MDNFLEHLSARVDATAADLKSSLHSHVDSTVDSRLDTFKVELASLVRSAVVECIRTEGRYQHWRAETTYTPIGSVHQHNPPNEVVTMSDNNSTSFICGIPPPLLTEFSAASTSQCIADLTFPSGHSVSIPLYIPNHLESQHISGQSSLLSNDNLDTTEQDISAESVQTNNSQQINPEPFQTDNRVSLLSIASTSSIISDGHSSTNSVSSESPSNVSSPPRTVQPPNDIHIKQEQLDDQLDNEVPSTNPLNVTLDIKTESMDCNFVVVKEEIKEEDDCDGCNRWIVKKEEVSDDDEVDNDGHGLPIEEVNDESGVIRGGDNDEVDDEPNLDNGQLVSKPSRDNQSASNVNESIDEGGASLGSQEQIATDDVLSPSTSTGQGSNQIALNEQATVSTQQKVTKRKQPTSKRSAKRLKKTVEDDDDDEGGEDIANEDREETKVKIVYLNCTESNCTAKLNSVVHLHDHLRTVHQLSHLQCFATNCNARFDHSHQICAHMKLLHSQSTRFECTVCHKECDSQRYTYKHWYRNHLTGQFVCHLTDDCAQVTDNRSKMITHQQIKHRNYSKHFHCTQAGCTATFTFKAHLKHHERTHLDGDKFHCNWPKCSHRTKQRDNLVTHIRTQHFGLPKSMKEQKEKNIVDQRDPNEYVRVVVDE